MSGDMRVRGFKPPTEKWRKMRAIWDACKASNVEPPAVVEEFFNGEPPDPAGVDVDEEDLVAAGAVREWEADMEEGREIDVTKLPPDVTVIRVYMSY